MSKKTVKQEFERKKLENMSHAQRQKKMKEKLTKYFQLKTSSPVTKLTMVAMEGTLLIPGLTWLKLESQQRLANHTPLQNQ